MKQIKEANKMNISVRGSRRVKRALAIVFSCLLVLGSIPSAPLAANTADSNPIDQNQAMVAMRPVVPVGQPVAEESESEVQMLANGLPPSLLIDDSPLRPPLPSGRGVQFRQIEVTPGETSATFKTVVTGLAPSDSVFVFYARPLSRTGAPESLGEGTGKVGARIKLACASSAGIRGELSHCVGTATGLNSDTTYWYALQARDRQGRLLARKFGRFTTLKPPPPAPAPTIAALNVEVDGNTATFTGEVPGFDIKKHQLILAVTPEMPIRMLGPDALGRPTPLIDISDKVDDKGNFRYKTQLPRGEYTAILRLIDREQKKMIDQESQKFVLDPLPPPKPQPTKSLEEAIAEKEGVAVEAIRIYEKEALPVMAPVGVSRVFYSVAHTDGRHYHSTLAKEVGGEWAAGDPQAATVEKAFQAEGFHTLARDPRFQNLTYEQVQLIEIEKQKQISIPEVETYGLKYRVIGVEVLALGIRKLLANSSEWHYEVKVRDSEPPVPAPIEIGTTEITVSGKEVAARVTVKNLKQGGKVWLLYHRVLPPGVRTPEGEAPIRLTRIEMHRAGETDVFKAIFTEKIPGMYTGLIVAENPDGKTVRGGVFQFKIPSPEIQSQSGTPIPSISSISHYPWRKPATFASRIREEQE